jgi:hypothetical protein
MQDRLNGPTRDAGDKGRIFTQIHLIKSRYLIGLGRPKKPVRQSIPQARSSACPSSASMPRQSASSQPRRLIR